MKSFKEYLLEVVRSIERAGKLVDNLTKRYKSDSIKIKKHEEYPFDAESNRYSRKKIPIKDIVPTQTSVDSHILKNKLRGSSTMIKSKGEEDKVNKSIDVVHHKGKYYITNGHHRYYRAKLLGQTHINANVDLGESDETQ